MHQNESPDRAKERVIQFDLIKLKKNGFEKESVRGLVSSNTSLLEFLREKASLTGAKESCGVGECGSCTVIMNGQAVRSCLILAFEADGAEIMTIESLASENELHPIQQSFIEHDAIQCGYCTPGFVMAAYRLYQKNPNPSQEEILESMSGHLCRCTGYQIGRASCRERV